MAPRIDVVPNEQAVTETLGKEILRLSKTILEKRETFNVGLSGGSLVGFLSTCLPTLQTDFSRWRFFFCDERLVPEESPDNTFGTYRRKMLENLPIKAEQFLVAKTDLDPDKAAQDYQERLLDLVSADLSRLDLLLLGMGPDGHTCSLFPGHQLLSEPAPTDGGRVVAPITDSPKPPPARITLTLPVVNSAACCIFAAAGAGKAGVIAKVLGDQNPAEEPLPARLVRPTNGEVIWILDEAAAQQLPKKC